MVIAGFSNIGVASMDTNQMANKAQRQVASEVRIRTAS